jgi:hypothetical protein
MTRIDANKAEDRTLADISVTASGSRRMLEAIYLELRELAKHNGLKIEYRLTQSPPGDRSGQPDSA